MGKRELSIIYAAIVAAGSPLEDWMSHAAALKSHMMACHRGYGLRCCWFQTNNSRPSEERLTVSLSAELKNTRQLKHTAHFFQGSLQMFHCKQPQLCLVRVCSTKPMCKSRKCFNLCVTNCDLKGGGPIDK